jgi:hypothetical protein
VASVRFPWQLHLSALWRCDFSTYTLQVGAHALLVKAAARAVAKRSGMNELEAAPETGVLPS